MFKELNKNEMMDVVGGGYPVAVPVYGSNGQYLGLRMVDSDTGIKGFWIQRKGWYEIPFYDDGFVPPKNY